MKTRLTSRLSVPPKPTAILEGSVSRRLGSRAPRPTLIPERPRQSTATIPMCSAIITGLIPSIRSLRKTRTSVATSEIPAENANLPQRICSRSQRKQAEDPEVPPFEREQREDEPAGERREDQGRHREVEEADQVPPGRALDAVAQPGDVQEVERQQPEEDQELRPLRRVAAEGPQVLEDQQADRLGQEEEEPVEDRVERVAARRGAGCCGFPGPGCSRGNRGRGPRPPRPGRRAPAWADRTIR